MSELQIVGGGRMGEAFLAGLINAGLSPDQVAVVETDKTRRAQLADAYGVATSATVTRAPDAIVAVKPGLVVEVCTSLATAGVKRVVSVAAGVRIAALEAALGSAVVVVRAMPNTPALVGRGAAALAGGSCATEVDIEWAQSLLSSVGVAVVVSESALDAVTGLSGSGPAYVFMFAEALVDAG
ncbi:MAG: NAD(P)-binding domain-containing protein, partial [Actinobacteria bacterium]|nr:NAD(P)-binding domain-containing protein [Actinomycetota bacterium]